MKLWFIETILKRAIPRAVAGLVALAASHGILTLLESYGVHIDPQKFQIEVTAGALILADVALRHLKQAGKSTVNKIKGVSQ